MTTSSPDGDSLAGTQSRGEYPATKMHFSELTAEVLHALKHGDSGDARGHDGRVIAVKTTPARGTASSIVVGAAALPPGYSTPAHHHLAEEVAVVMSGSGHVEIDGDVHTVTEGTVLVTPSNSTHITTADESGPLVILWFYSPPGSETRWLRD
ncbi:MAG TPA: cupin domain-containing protein [Acidimicrobiia bacterium]|nr:cupin domain-containing protein [Acidimicrobiia bacterium]